MKSKVVPVKNIARLTAAADVLRRRAPGMPGMGLVHGETGYGKTTAIQWLINRVNGVYVRALAVWTPAAMLSALLRDLGVEPRGGCSQMMDMLIEKLADSERPVFIDEADYLINSARMTESLRDLHDMTLVPIVLIGMGGIDQKLAHRKQLTGRVLQDVRFEPADAEDARLIANGLCEVTVADDLLDRVHRASRGEVRRLVVGLARIEERARALAVSTITAEHWGRGDAFFTGEASIQSTPGKVTSIGGAR